MRYGTFETVRAALQSINAHNGRGDLVSVNARAGTFTVKPYGLRPETFRYTRVGRRVSARGTTRTLAR